MQLAHRAALDGAQLDGLDGRILVTGIRESAGRIRTESEGYGFRDGSRVTGEKREYLDVSIGFKIKDLHRGGMAEREEILEKINGWARGGGYLTVNYKPGRRLRVRMQQAAEHGDPWNWTGEYTLGFRAWGVPYWEADTAAAVTFGIGQGCAGTLAVDGTARTAADASFQNTSGSRIDAVTIHCGGSSMTFSGLGLENGETLVIDHDPEGLLRIRIRSTGGTYRSALGARTAESSDELYTEPGNVSCSYSPRWTASCTVSCRGRWI